MWSQTGMSRAGILTAFADSFRRRYATRDSSYTQAELDAAKVLVDNKFGIPE